MKKTIIVILFSLAMPLTSFAQINYGVVVAAGTSKMVTANFQDNWGEFYSGGLSLSYTDKNNFIYETGLYFDYRDLKIDHYSSELSPNVDGILYHIKDLKIPFIFGTKIDNGLFSKFNLIIQGGMFFSYGLNGKGKIYYYSDLHGDWYNVNNVFKTNNTIINSTSYEYSPLKRFDTGILLKAGLKYQQFYFSLNSETGLVNLNSYYDSKIRSSSLYLSIAYNFAK